MKLFIQIRDGQPYEHPILEDNFRQAFPHIDPDNLPLEFALFERVENPNLAGFYQVNEHSSYEWDGSVVKDVWTVREMTAEERAKKQQPYKDAWAKLPNRDNFIAFVFNEETLQYDPPIPRPETGDYFWQGTTSSWVERPQRPDDDKVYKLDYASASWVEVPQP
jgi:hypothetical protein